MVSEKIKFYLSEGRVITLDNLESQTQGCDPLFHMLFNVKDKWETMSKLLNYLDKRKFLHISSPTLPPVPSEAKRFDLLVKFSDAPCWIALFRLFNRKLLAFRKQGLNKVETYTFEGLCDKWQREVKSSLLLDTLKKLYRAHDQKEFISLKRKIWDHVMAHYILLSPIAESLAPIIDTEEHLRPLYELTISMTSLFDDNLPASLRHTHLKCLAAHFGLRLIKIAGSEETLRKNHT